jgi:hypothetical protein
LADACTTMVEMLGIYALLLTGWGLWHARRQVAEVAPVEPPEVEPAIERGDAARRLLNTLP